MVVWIVWRRCVRQGGIGRGVCLYFILGGMGVLVLASWRVFSWSVVKIEVASTPKTVVKRGVVIFVGVFPRWIVYWTL